MIEIIARDTCPTCGGTGKWEQQTVLGPIIGPCHVCDEETRTVPRVLATFADAAELWGIVRRSIDGASIPRKYGQGVDGATDAVLAALGVNDEN